MADNAFNREACFWVSTSPGDNGSVDRERRYLNDDGDEVVERFPQSGHAGDYDDRRPARGLRWVPIVRHEGHVVALVLTNAAAHMDASTPWAHYQRAKAAYHGWFMPGSCPIALLASGELQKKHIRAKKLLTEKAACAPGSHSNEQPCPHALAEIEARREANAKRMEKLEADTAKNDPTNRLVEAQRATADKLSEAVQTIAASVAKGGGK